MTMSDRPTLAVVETFEPKKPEPVDCSNMIEHLQSLIDGMKAGEITGIAVTWASIEGATSTWWDVARGGKRRGHINDLAAGISRLAWRYQAEAYDESSTER